MISFTVNRLVKTDLARQAIMDKVGPFALGDVLAVVPAVSPRLVKKLLQSMKEAGILSSQGRGRGAVWEVIRRER